MKLSREEVEHVALLARLQLSEEEVELYTEQLNSILGYAEMLQKLNTDQVSPTAHAVQLFNVLREDEVKPSMSQDKILMNAPDEEDGFFRVPRIV
ncbi:MULTISPECIES: Asp-tRNA(Asn)/Glu-tRNA(Gln) amidotransferase subunit GatC [Dehalobacter]|jgi:aspartyl-tRNA(Asn)/glutamyl-tRNA(Gln) amidotransferase subunit C|uniref:Aspartyl/glutamyl-tRNA(Asn/Gln) amidotransferase subunit C n=2 Tax=Dehalobacter restrictus TaxID=55583 RepID=A0A857DL59_9FIRM|nr:MULTISPECIES: Asp-tRNA(Asn)/Glu-tRNA(Gln) amidotransferase subunit GatC [Dehalobacter]AHF10499.1 glutamyl-tRNA amidotransferase subunit C [Dehalobacter restrictus DSM 9455]MCG1025422.1 Asp-tRNA(Asn)/Glu-tRNA(Gln) amidotransferase subunit GatC [Dehalobacter sp.]MDJ0305666.1 Asp-tRNA(Asn)/Glu-tRNA(Gln) amidotransferase subunit GatC [Dehalobacter sp.]OCZ51096.1 asparaginyl/glutamyl-tRNA amidotransferase subunit C [Dehalobacter sp. TeCB1]QHA01125.1 Asp-tRNA(Asn)/Glu-tRNA(Gln) amidotransferase s